MTGESREGLLDDRWRIARLVASILFILALLVAGLVARLRSGFDEATVGPIDPFVRLQIEPCLEGAFTDSRSDPKDWERIGSFRLIENGTTYDVKLYVYDDESIWDKTNALFRDSHNLFSLYGVYRAGNGPWQGKELYSVWRNRFHKVGRVTPNDVEIMLRGNVMVFLTPGEEPLVPPETVNAPFSKMLSIQNGVLVLQ